MKPAAFALALALLSGDCAAQTQAACHKGHHDAGYRMTAMPAPPLRTGLGATALRMTTQSAQAQQYFVQGVELLHCFWDFEAHRAFQEAARLDPGAAMAWWGIVQSISDYKAMDEEKKAALEKIKALLPKASEQEQFYLRAQQKQNDSDDDDSGGYQKEMEALIDAHPEDIDARLFLAIGLRYSYADDGQPGPDTLYALSIVQTVLAEHPENAAAEHYLIHLLESGPHAGRALHAADVLGKLAPASGHMVHMPGHIYYKIGDQERARKSFLDSMRVDEEYMQREKVSPLDDWNYAHNLSYLIASDAEAGRYQEALALAAKLDRLPANPFLAVGRPLHAITVGGTAARLQLRYGNWRAVIEHPIGLGDEERAGAPAITFRDGVQAYARGMQALEEKHPEEASRQADALDALQWRLQNDRSDDDEGGKPDRVFSLLETASLDLRGNLECLRGNTEAGFNLLKKAIDKEKAVGYNEPPQYGRPQLESLGYAYLRASQWDQARTAFQDELLLRPKSGHALYGLALTCEKAGQKAGAARAYAEFLAAWKNADPELPMVRHARAFGNS